VLGIGGNLLIISLPLPTIASLVGMALWSLISVRELRALRCAWAGCVALRITANGDVGVLGPNLEWRSAQLVSGSILLRKAGWIRLKTGSGRVFAELVRAGGQRGRDWRRLQVIWRHIGA